MVTGTFSREAIGAGVGADADLGALAEEAACHYLDDRDSGRIGWRYPSFRAAVADAEPIDAWPAIGTATAPALVREADRQDVTAEQLLRHAVLYYLADLDAGRVRRRSGVEAGDRAGDALDLV